jgi:hypothetical protein
MTRSLFLVLLHPLERTDLMLRARAIAPPMLQIIRFVSH